MKKMVASFKVSLDGCVEGSSGELDWVAEWSEDFELLNQMDTCVLGGGMYPGYEQYWTSVLADPDGILSFTGRKPTEGEIEYARFADKTPHYVLTNTLAKTNWKAAEIVHDINKIKKLKEQPGKNIYVIGGATLVSSLMNHGLIDELRLSIHPIVLGRGKTWFKDVTDRHPLQLIHSGVTASGEVNVIYNVLK